MALGSEHSPTWDGVGFPTMPRPSNRSDGIVAHPPGLDRGPTGAQVCPDASGANILLTVGMASRDAGWGGRWVSGTRAASLRSARSPSGFCMGLLRHPKIKAGNSRVKPLGRRKRRITVAAFVQGGGRETLSPLCARRVGSRKALLTDAHKRGILQPEGEFAPSSRRLWLRPDPAAAHGYNTKAVRVLYGAFHAAAPSSHPSHPTESSGVGPGPTPGYSSQKKKRDRFNLVSPSG